eukprot:c29024_g2_i1 orf=101-2146(+)
MDELYLRSRGKRSHSYDYWEAMDSYNRHSKRHSSSQPRSELSLPSPPRVGSEEIVFRILCPEAKAGSVIGVGGSIIKALRQETGSKITIADAVPGSDDRVITISARERDRGYGRDRDRARGRDSDFRDRDDREADGRHRDGVDRAGSDIVSPAQEALLRVHSRIVEGGNEEEDQDSLRLITTRLIVPNNQVGCLLGKGGKVIEQMREETKAQIRVLPRDQLPLCTLSSDEIVQIVGDVDVVKKALRIVSSRLRDNFPRDHGLNISRMRSPSHHREFLSEADFVPLGSSSAPVHRRDVNGQLRGVLPAFSHPGASGFGNTLYSDDPHRAVSALHDVDRQPSAAGEELVFRILCPLDKVGCIIGRGGSIIRSLRDEIGAGIRVADAVPGSDERVVIISAMEHPDDNLSPAQEALLHIQSRIVDLGPDEDAVVTTRLLVPSDQVGCLIGKGGSIIAEMRKSTHANIRILGMDALPNCALPNDELVQIVGDIRVAREALIQVTRRLRGNLHDKSLSSSASSMSSSLGAPGSYSRHEPGSSPEKMHLPFSVLSNDRRSTSSYRSLSPSPGLWAAQDVGGGRKPADDRPSLQPGSGLFSRSSGAIITKTTVEVVIPEHAINAVIGKPGSIAQIRELSGAKVSLVDVGPEASEKIVEISGTPEQTHAAQCLLQAFILSGQTSSHDYIG